MAALLPLPIGAPLLATAVLLLVPGTRHRIRAAEWVSISWWLAPAVSVLSLWALRPLDELRAVSRCWAVRAANDDFCMMGLLTWRGGGRGRSS